MLDIRVKVYVFLCQKTFKRFLLNEFLGDAFYTNMLNWMFANMCCISLIWKANVFHFLRRSKCHFEVIGEGTKTDKNDIKIVPEN